MMDVLSARGIDVELADRYGLESRFPAAGGEGAERLVFPVMWEDQVVKRKLWTPPAPGEAKGKWAADKGGRRLPFNADVLRDDSLIGMPLVITEGEFDALATIQCGHLRTISAPDGAPTEPVSNPADSKAYAWIEELRPYLTPERVSEIVLAVDDDAPGAALLHDLSVLFHRSRCKYVRYPRLRADKVLSCKDMNRTLMDYGAKGVEAVLERAKWLRIEGVMRMSEAPPVPPPTIYELNPQRWRLLADHLKPMLGTLWVVTGIPNFGKTTWVSDVLNDVAFDNDLTIAWASFEQKPQTHHRRNLRRWFCSGPEHEADRGLLAAADAWIEARHVFIVPTEDEDADLMWLVDRMETAVRRYGAKVLVIDPWNEVEHGRRPGETETEYTNRAVRLLKRFADRFQVLVVLVAHPTKSVKDADGTFRMPTLYDISGSANFYNKCDVGIIVHRPNGEETHVKVGKVKFQDIMGVPGTVAMHYSKDANRFIETERVA